MNQLMMKKKELVRWFALGLFAMALIFQLVYAFGNLSVNSTTSLASGLFVFLALAALSALIIAGFLKDKALWILGGTFLLLSYVGIEGFSGALNSISSTLDGTAPFQTYGFSIIMEILIGLALAASLAFFILGYFFNNPLGKLLYAILLAAAVVLYLALAIGDAIVSARGWLCMMEDFSFLFLLSGLAFSGVYCLTFVPSGKTAPEAAK